MEVSRAQSGPASFPSILRRALIAQLEFSRAQLISIVAPAGFGKSTLARQFSRNFHHLTTLDCSGVREPADLSRRLVAAVEASLREQVPWLAYARLGQPRAAEATGRLADLALSAWRFGPDNALFVFDNAEDLCRPSFDRSGLYELLGSIEAERTVVFCSRTPLPFMLTRFLPPNKVLALDSSSLAFSEDEIADVFADCKDVLDTKQICSATQGWPVAVLFLQRLALQGQLESALNRLASADLKEMRSYIVEEVIRQLGRRQRELLLTITVLPNPSLDDIVALGYAKSASLAASIVRELPLCTLDGSRVSIHPLIQSALQGADDPQIQGVVGDAVRHFSEAKLFHRAAAVLARAGDQEGAARLLDRIEPYFFSNAISDCADVVEQLDIDTICRHPKVWLATAPFRAFAINAERHVDEAQDVFFSLTSDATPSVRASVAVMYASALHAVGRFDECVETLNDEIESFGDKYPVEVATLRLSLAARNGLVGRFKRAHELIERAALPQLEYLHSRTLDFVEGHAAFMRGRYDRGAGLMAHALRKARRAGGPTAILSTLNNWAFFAWVFGDDKKLRQLLAELDRELLPGLEPTFGVLGRASRGARDANLGQCEIPAFRACAWLLASASVDSPAEALMRVNSAVRDAGVAQDPYLSCLALLAAGELQPDAAQRYRRSALDWARRLETPELHAAIESLLAGARRTEFLKPFLERFHGKSRSSSVSALYVEVLKGVAHRGPSVIPLTEREFELVVLLAWAKHPLTKEYIWEALWPDSEAASASNNLKVTVHRVRSKLGADIIIRDGVGYRLSPFARVDYREIEATIRTLRRQSQLGSSDRQLLEEFAARLSEPRPVCYSSWEWFEGNERALVELGREASLRLAADALSRGEPSYALSLAEALMKLDASDEESCELQLHSLIEMGLPDEAVRRFGAYKAFLATELDSAPSTRIVHLMNRIKTRVVIEDEEQ